MSQKKRCRVQDCEAKPLRGKPMCKEHDEQFEIQLVPCTGDAHKPEVAGNIDHCMVCMPRWGQMEVLVERKR